MNANKEKVSNKYREYWTKNAEQLRSDKREYYAKNKEAIAEQKLEYREKNRAAIKKRRKENSWRYNDSARIFSSKRRALKKKASGSYILDDIHGLMQSQNNTCNACKDEISFNKKNGFHVDHIIPLSKGGSNWPENLQLLCVSCNCSKHDLLPHEWAERKRKFL